MTFHATLTLVRLSSLSTALQPTRTAATVASCWLADQARDLLCVSDVGACSDDHTVTAQHRIGITSTSLSLQRWCWDRAELHEWEVRRPWRAVLAMAAAQRRPGDSTSLEPGDFGFSCGTLLKLLNRAATATVSDGRPHAAATPGGRSGAIAAFFGADVPRTDAFTSPDAIAKWTSVACAPAPAETKAGQSEQLRMSLAKLRYVVVLGAPLQPDGVTPGSWLHARLEMALRSYRRVDSSSSDYGVQGCRILVTGTQEEASAMRSFLSARGVPAAHLLVESNSKDTIQNAINTAQMLLAEQRMHEIVVVTSSFHVRRAREYFEAILGAYGLTAHATITFEGAAEAALLQPPGSEKAACNALLHSATVERTDECIVLRMRKEQLLQERSAPVLRTVVRKIEQVQAQAKAREQQSAGANESLRKE